MYPLLEIGMLTDLGTLFREVDMTPMTEHHLTRRTTLSQQLKTNIIYIFIYFW